MDIPTTSGASEDRVICGKGMSSNTQALDLRRSISRTLTASGYVVTRGYRHPSHVTIDCERSDTFGCRLAYLVAVTDHECLPARQVAELRRRCEADGRLLVVVSREGTANQLALREFLDRLGGDVPKWRALTEEFHDHLLRAARNDLPDGESGPAWRLLEELVSDGLEFALGRRARRLGGRSPGARVPDTLVVSPDERLYLLDSKAAASPFDVNWSSLRSLGEYVHQQRERQRGSIALDGALIVSSNFAQDAPSLTKVALEFSAQHRVMLSFLSAETLSRIVSTIRNNVDVRNALQWRKIFRGGLVDFAIFEQELQGLRSQRVER